MRQHPQDNRFAETEDGRYEPTEALEFAEIAALKGVSRQAVNQTHDRAIRKLEESLRAMGVGIDDIGGYADD